MYRTLFYRDFTYDAGAGNNDYTGHGRAGYSFEERERKGRIIC